MWLVIGRVVDGKYLAGLRDRALICTMLFSFARISAVLSLKRQDFYYQGPRRWLRFHEKGGKEHEMPRYRRDGLSGEWKPARACPADGRA
jgi:integrase